MTITRSIANLERLMTAHNAHINAGISDDGSVEAAERLIRAQDRLLDACVACGMEVDGDEFAFAAEHVTRFLVEA